jgi:hypothetical protein
MRLGLSRFGSFYWLHGLFQSFIQPQTDRIDLEF